VNTAVEVVDIESVRFGMVFVGIVLPQSLVGLVLPQSLVGLVSGLGSVSVGPVTELVAVELVNIVSVDIEVGDQLELQSVGTVHDTVGTVIISEIVLFVVAVVVDVGVAAVETVGTVVEIVVVVIVVAGIGAEGIEVVDNEKQIVVGEHNTVEVAGLFHMLSCQLRSGLNMGWELCGWLKLNWEEQIHLCCLLRIAAVKLGMRVLVLVKLLVLF